MHKCPRCNEKKSDSEFYFKNNGHLNGYCKSCQKAKTAQRREEIKQYIREQKEVPCADCKKSYPYYVMDFDHLEDKSFNISGSVKYKGFKQIKAEIKKCDVVCSNCHRVRTYSRIK